MSHTILSLQAQRFNSRVTLGGCLINVNGETVACEVSIDTTRFVCPKYTVRDERGEVLCTFTPYTLWEGPVIYSIDRRAEQRASASLIVPGHDLLKNEEEEDETECEDAEV